MDLFLISAFGCKEISTARPGGSAELTFLDWLANTPGMECAVTFYFPLVCRR
jgi:hypothetical protein